MIFGAVPLSEALGAVLAHSVPLAKGRLRKGKLLEAGDIAALQAEGHDPVIVARLEPGDVGEDAAARAVAEALMPDARAAGLRVGTAATGRVNLYATGPGVLRVDADAIAQANRIDPMITLATLPPVARLAEGQMVATIKVIAYAVAGESLARFCAACAGTLGRHAVTLKDALLIETVIPGARAGKGVAAIRARLDRLGMALSDVQRVAHETAPLAEAISAASADLVLVLTGSATSDPHDVAPEALRVAGGAVERFGMPVDPGNLLFLGSLGARPVIGLPGCARSPALNGADWVLERIACGLTVSDADIAAMGVGGLLKDIPQRGRARDA